jgi:hypothetical protein
VAVFCFFVVFVIGFVAVVSFLYALGCNPYLYSSLMIGRTAFKKYIQENFRFRHRYILRAVGGVKSYMSLV